MLAASHAPFLLMFTKKKHIDDQFPHMGNNCVICVAPVSHTPKEFINIGFFC
jgi:hypothetical protein